eukprot:TRINITY_DN22234_c0_g1_i1.p1 TRINITY_DN22234_c0_g1~~TRINITY_DN22234_c0_g1_i1.p1  ORF type:complete len:462 (+),score=72.02 TRINITY_DN22234_c0_g1_i1:103-1488(+)
MGLSSSRSDGLDNNLPSLAPEVLPSLYWRRLALLARDLFERPPREPLEQTLRGCIAFCYGVTREWAPHVRVTVFADNPAEHQVNVPVYDVLLRTWSAPGFESTRIPCRAVPGTDVESGLVAANPFWSRTVAEAARALAYRDLVHGILEWFLALQDGDARKQLLVNILLQLHEACFNCIGRHKEVFEYCVYDLIDAETTGPAVSEAGPENGLGASPTQAARQTVRRFADRFLDRHKRAALHAAILSPIKFLFQNHYEVYENLDSHGASFWVAVLCAFFPGLEMPYESIEGLDKGWAWGAVDFLPAMREGDSKLALERLSNIECFDIDWRQRCKGLKPPQIPPGRIPGLTLLGPSGFARAIAEVRRPGSALRRRLQPCVARFAAMVARPVLLRRCALNAVTSLAWESRDGPAFAALSEVALGEALTPAALRERLVPDVSDPASIHVDVESFAMILRAAGVAWA